MPDPDSLVLVVGAGPGVGGSVARRWARDGHPVALLSLIGPDLEALGQSMRADGIEVDWAVADLTDDASTRSVIEGLVRGREVGVLHFNPSAFRQEDPLTLSPAALLEDVALGVGGLLSCVQAVRPYLVPGSRVTATGSVAADKPWNEACSLGVQKAGLRNLVRSLDTTLAPSHVRAVSVTVRGVLAYDDESSGFHPTRVAEALYAAAHQDVAAWQPELPYDG